MVAVNNDTRMQYCEKCGEMLIWIRDEPRGFHRLTGKRLSDASVYACPKWREFSTFGSEENSHDNVHVVSTKDLQTYG